MRRYSNSVEGAAKRGAGSGKREAEEFIVTGCQFLVTQNSKLKTQNSSKWSSSSGARPCPFRPILPRSFENTRGPIKRVSLTLPKDRWRSAGIIASWPGISDTAIQPIFKRRWMGSQRSWQPTFSAFGSLDSRSSLPASICPWTPVVSLKKILSKDLLV